MRPAPDQCVLSTPTQWSSPSPPPAPGERFDSHLPIPASAEFDSDLKVLTKKQKQVIDKALQLEDAEMEAALLHTIHYKSPIQRQRLDLIEVCTPSDSPLADTVIKRGGTAERFGLHNADLSSDPKFPWARKRANIMKPRHMWFSPPCTMFSQMQNANLWCKKSDFEKQEFRKRYAKALLVFNRCLIWAIDQLNRGGEAHSENPLHSRCWKLDSKQCPQLQELWTVLITCAVVDAWTTPAT